MILELFSYVSQLYILYNIRWWSNCEIGIGKDVA